MTLRLAALLSTLMLSAPVTLHAETVDDPIVRVDWVWIELDAAGDVTDVATDESLNPLIAGALREQVRLLDFAPATADGVAVASGVPLRMTLRFVPVADGGLRPELVSARLLPAQPLSVPVPRYPPRPMMAGVGGVVRVQFVAGTDGRVGADSLAVADSGFFRAGGRPGSDERRDLEAAAIDAARGWTWRNARIGSETVTVRIQKPLAFRPPAGDSCAALPEALASRAVDDAPMEVVETRVQLPALTTAAADVAPVADALLEACASRVRHGGA